MARVPVFLCIGSSNMAGLNSFSNSIPSLNYTRWFGGNSILAPPSINPSTTPAPGVKMWTPKLPHSVPDTRNIQAVPAGDQVDFDGANLVAGDIGRWLFIQTNSTGQGNLRRITAGAGSTVATVSPAFSPAIAANGTLHLLTNSYSVAAGSDTLTIVKAAATKPDFVAGDVGRWVRFYSGNTNNIVRRIATVTPPDTFTLEDPLNALVPYTPAVNDGFQLLSAVNTTADRLTNFSVGAEFRDLAIHLNNPPVLLNGFDWNNYDNDAPYAPSSGTAPYEINCVPELAWQLRNSYSQTIYLAEIGVSASTISPQYIGAVLRTGYFAWLRDVEGLDFNPGSPNNLYDAVQLQVASITSLLAAQGDTPDYDACFVLLADNEGFYPEKIARIGDNMRLLRDAIRTLTGNPRMKWIMAGTTNDFYGGASGRAQMEAQLDQVAQDDAWSGHSSSHGEQFTIYIDGSHLDGPGQVARGKAFFDTWVEVSKKANNAARVLAEMPTLASLRTKVRRRYERSDVGNSDNPTQIDQFINDSIRELYHLVGDDKAWFLRRVEQVDVSGGLYPNTIALPRQVKRLLRIEPVSRPGMQLTWKGLAHTDEGRTQITLHETCTGPFNLHFIALTKDLVIDTDVALVPDEYTELVVVLACKRLTENAGNSTMAQYYMAEAARLTQQVKRSCALHDRMRQPQLETLGAYDSWRNGAWPGGDEWGL